MSGVFMYAANAVLPIVLLILLGYFLRCVGFYDDKFLKTANKLGFRVALPTLLFYNVYEISSLGAIKWSGVIFAVAAILVLFVLGLIVVKIAVRDDRQKGVVLQSAFRSNFAIIGVPLAEALGGSETLAVVSVLSAFSIALFNVLGVVSLSVFVGEENDKKPGFKSVFVKIIKNPLIIGIVLGLLTVAVRSLEPLGVDSQPVFTIKNDLPFLYSAISTLAKMASPLMLIVLGGQFSFKAVKELKGQIILGTAMRILIAPLLGLGAAVLLSGTTSFFSFNASEYAAFVALFGSPIAVSSAVMAAEMGNDEQLAGQLVVWTSIGSVFTVFLSAVILKTVGLL